MTDGSGRGRSRKRSTMNASERIPILDVAVSATNMQGALDTIAGWIERKRAPLRVRDGRPRGHGMPGGRGTQAHPQRKRDDRPGRHAPGLGRAAAGGPADGPGVRAGFDAGGVRAFPKKRATRISSTAARKAWRAGWPKTWTACSPGSGSRGPTLLRFGR